MTSTRSPRFTAIVVGALFIYLVALIFGLPTLYFMAAGLVVAPLVSYALARFGLGDIVAERRVPERLWPDERVEFELRLNNRAKLPKCLLRIDEELPEGLAGDPDRPPGCVAPMLWGEPYLHRYPVTAVHRGRYELPPVTCTALDTFDLCRVRREVGPANEIVVYPRRVPLGTHALHAPNLDGAVRRNTRPLASGTDFRATREYLPGDDLRRVHWKSTARRGRPIVVEYEALATSDLFLIPDVGARAVIGAGRRNTFETALCLAASLVEQELVQGNAVGLFLDTPEPTLLPLTRERMHRLRFFEALALVEPRGDLTFARTIATAAELAPTEAVSVLLSTDHDPDLLGPLQQLARRHAVAYVWVEPAGHAGVGAVDDAPALDFLRRLKTLGVTVFRVAPERLALGLARAL